MTNSYPAGTHSGPCRNFDALRPLRGLYTLPCTSCTDQGPRHPVTLSENGWTTSLLFFVSQQSWLWMIRVDSAGTELLGSARTNFAVGVVAGWTLKPSIPGDHENSDVWLNAVRRSTSDVFVSCEVGITVPLPKIYASLIRRVSRSARCPFLVPLSGLRRCYAGSVRCRSPQP